MLRMNFIIVSSIYVKTKMFPEVVCAISHQKSEPVFRCRTLESIWYTNTDYDAINHWTASTKQTPLQLSSLLETIQNTIEFYNSSQ